MNERIERLLGMDFDAFCRSVLLAQNRFAEFLRATRAERERVLKGVFGYERFDAALAAATRAGRAGRGDRRGWSVEGARVVEAKAALAEAEAGAEAAVRVRDFLRALAPKVDALDTATPRPPQQTARAAVEAETVGRAAARAPGPDDVARAAASADEAATGVDAAQIEAERTRRGGADRQGGQGCRRRGGRRLQAFTELVRATQRAGRRGHRRRTQRSSAREPKPQRPRPRSPPRRERRATAVHQRDQAEAARGADAEGGARRRRRARSTTHAMPAWRRPCARRWRAAIPVRSARQAVTTIPKVVKRASLTRTERNRNAAMTALKKTTTLRERATAAAAEASARETAAVADEERRASAVADAIEAARAAEAALATTQSELVDRLGEGDPDTLIAERRAELRRSGDR